MTQVDVSEHLDSAAADAVDSQRNGLPWKLRVEEPLNRFVHYPLARVVVRLLVRTPITPNQVTMVQPAVAALAGYLISFNDPLYLVAAVVVYELRSLLDCVDGTLARAKNMVSSNGHALDSFCDWISAVLLYAGIYWHFVKHPPGAAGWSAYLPVSVVVALALINGGLRSFAADHYLQKYSAIFDRGRDEEVENVHDKLLARRSDPSLMAKWEALIAWGGHATFEFEFYDPDRSRPLNADEVAELQRAQHQPLTRFVAGLWSVSNGDFWLTLTLASALLGVLWPAMVFFATAGFVWVALVVAFNTWFIRRTVSRAHLVAA